MASASFPGTAPWLRSQWSNPGDIFTILLIIGGDVVQVAIAQLCGGRIPYLTPVVFSFGWVTYAVSAVLSAFGENRLMPKPEIECCVISTTMGYRRNNCSWVLSRLLKDFESWRDPRVEKEEKKKLKELSEERKKMKGSSENKRPERQRVKDVKAVLRVTVWKCERADGKPKGDFMYWIGIFVALIQLVIAAIPWILHGEWLIFFVTAVGTLLAFASGALPQWRKEKFGARQRKKDVLLTRGNGAHDVLLILGCDGGMDLESLASPYRDLGAGQLTRWLSIVFATCWVALLITIAGYDQHTWYLVGVGMIGIVQNLAVAGRPRNPSAFGIHLTYEGTYVDFRVMAVLWALEKDYPNAGACLIDEFFPGKLLPREERLWEYAKKRHETYKDAQKEAKAKKEQNISAEEPRLWGMPRLNRPGARRDDSDIPEAGEYKGGVHEAGKFDKGSPGDIPIQVEP